MTKSKKTILIVALIFVILAIAFGVSLYFLIDDNKSYKELYEEERVRIVSDQKTVGEYSLSELKNLSAPKKFEAAYKPSHAASPIYREYEGIELRLLFEALEISLEGKTEVSFTGYDGYKSVYSLADIQRPDNVFIAFRYDDKEFVKGLGKNVYPEEEGGPLVVIRAADQFSQNRVKALVEIEI